jgi:hypothetical protein
MMHHTVVSVPDDRFRAVAQIVGISHRTPAHLSQPKLSRGAITTFRSRISAAMPDFASKDWIEAELSWRLATGMGRKGDTAQDERTAVFG